ncbi:MAG: Transcriptional regulatory protein ZraR [bacterium]|nr:Transcriptional regulatory protein ZraR [bacterium]
MTAFERETEILLVEDDPRFAQRLKRNLEGAGFAVEWLERGDTALPRIGEKAFHLLLTDIKMPGMSGLELLEAVKSKPGVDPDLPVVMLTSIDSVETAVQAMRLGASDYLKKDAERDEIVQRILKVLAEARVRRENLDLRARLSAEIDIGAVVALSPAMSAVMAEIRELAPTPATILIQGETGVGKEVIAREIHRLSGRRPEQWVAINCAALPEDDKFQSEVFGHERGAFTGATERKRGQFEQAEEGTLFLDEVGELSLDSQSKLLRVLETGEFTRMGGTQTLRLRARILLATNKDLRREVQEGRFRNDLFFRISVAPVTIPPLRLRAEDIDSLCRTMMADFSRRYGKAARSFSPAAMERLGQYSWPGNVRELRNVIEGLLIRGRTGGVEPGELRLEGPSAHEAAAGFQLPEAGMPLEEIERAAVRQALERTDYNQTAAAKLLHISPDRLAARMKKYGLHK